jgi:predicted MFS family arabinose efflux permease
VLGGVLASAFGWRSTFAALAATGAVLAPVIVFGVPETQQQMALRRFAARNGDAALSRIAGAHEILAAKSTLQPPWRSLG